MKSLRYAAIAVLFAAQASDAADPGECASISDDVVRLFCYDRAAGRAPAATPVSPAPVAAPAAAAAPPAEAPSPPTVAEPEKKAKPSKRIEARVVGRFEGWSQGTLFKLDNGQTWKAVGTGTHYSTSDSPKVVIERDFVGQNLMSVEGVKSRALVQRVDE